MPNNRKPSSPPTQRKHIFRRLLVALFLLWAPCTLWAHGIKNRKPQNTVQRPPSSSHKHPQLHRGDILIVRTQHFTFKYPRKWRKWVNALIQNSEQDLQQIQSSLGFQFKGHLQVIFASGGKSYAKIQPFPWHPPSYIAGLAYPKQGIMTLRLRGIDGLANTHQTFRHELSHLLLAKAAQHRSMPLWFVEGLAMVHSHDLGTLDRIWLLASARLSGRWPKLSTLRKRFPPHYGPRRIAYAVSFDFVTFLQKQKKDLIPATLSSMRKGMEFHKAIELHTQRSWARLQESWMKQSQWKYSWLALLSQEGLIWLVAILLLFLGYFRLKKKRKAQLQQWEEEEEAVELPWYPASPSRSYPFPTDRS